MIKRQSHLWPSRMVHLKTSADTIVAALGWHGRAGQDWTGQDRMEWDGMGWDGMEWDAAGCG